MVIEVGKEVDERTVTNIKRPKVILRSLCNENQPYQCWLDLQRKIDFWYVFNQILIHNLTFCDSRTQDFIKENEQSDPDEVFI